MIVKLQGNKNSKVLKTLWLINNQMKILKMIVQIKFKVIHFSKFKNFVMNYKIKYNSKQAAIQYKLRERRKKIIRR